VNFAGIRAAKPLRKQRIQRLNGAKTMGVCCFIGVLLLSAACGGHKTRVKTPLPRPSPTAPARKAETGKVPVPATQPPPVSKSAPPPEVVERPAPAAITVPAATEYPTGPPIKIGLTTAAKEIRISSSGEYSIMEKVPEAAQQLVQGEIQIRLEQGAEEASAVFRIQVASYSSPEAAEDLKAKLTESFSSPVVIHENAETGANQVRIGEFASKEDARPLLKSLAESGYRDAFIVRDIVSIKGGKIALALRGANDLFRLSPAGYMIQPSSNTRFLSLDGKPYRGVMEVFINKNGKITVVNQLGIEEYLLGVVPAEIPPSRYPEFDALAALAVASRTYALYHIGRFLADGFDLTADTRTQVYGGIALEEDATNEAVHRTAGLAVYYKDKLIDAMYMSTCGGRTEDFANVFDAPEVPYLKSVFCAIESGPEKGSTILEGKHELDQSIISDDGSVANRNIELARLLGITESRPEMTPDFLAHPAAKDEIVRWVENARKLAGKNRSNESPGVADIETRAGFLRYAAESLFGAAEIRRKISTRDLAYYMDNLKDGNAVPEPTRYALTYLVQNSLWRPDAENAARPAEGILRRDALFLLLNCVESLRPDILNKGIFVTAKSNGEAANVTIDVKQGKRTHELRLSEKLSLFRLDSGRAVPVNSIKILGNEKISFYAGSSGAIDFLEVELNPNGASSDRYSPAANWDVNLSRSAVAEKLRNLTGDIGQFRDMEPSRLGNSGRAVQVQATGSRSSVIINGYKVRGALGLKDTLYTLTREYNPDGSVAGFTFHGRGSGHGVGLCQVGAFGMARAGHSYEEILKTYYTGVEIKKAF
jgi:stage II sporulation protein D